MLEPDSDSIRTDKALAIFLPANNALGESLQRRQIARRDLEYKFRVDPVIGVTEQISEVHHSLPVDGFLLRFDVFGYSAGCFADDLKGAFNREPRWKVGREILR